MENYWYKKKKAHELSKATPLMQVFRSENLEDYKHFLQQDGKTTGSRRNRYSVLPIYTLSQELFYRIGESNQLTENEITDEFPDLSTDEKPVSVSLAAVFCDRELVYTPEQYQKHLWLTKEKANGL